MSVDYVAPKILFTAPQNIQNIIFSLGRTEDVKFSPSGQRLAVASFAANKIAIFDVFIASSQNSKNITFTAAFEISSNFLKCPHGVDFIDDEKIVVANRDGKACVFELPVGKTGTHELAPVAVIPSDDISTPGSVAVVRKEGDFYEVLICNNFMHRVTRHLFDLGKGYRANKNEILLEKWMDIPDSVCVSEDKRWIAVSNHTTHAILLYKNDSALNPRSSPDGILRNHYPHGLRFTSDDRFVVAASAGSPYVNVYQTESSDWQGVRAPILSVRVLNTEEFLRGRHGREEGGPKGVDIHDAMGVLVTTCEMQPLGFFDFDAVRDYVDDNFLQRQSVFRKKFAFCPNSLAVRGELYRERIIVSIIAAMRWILWKVRPLSWMLNRVRALLNVGPVPKPY